MNLEGDITVADVAALGPIDRLGLHFARGVTDEVVAAVGRITTLVALDLSCSDVTDAGVAHLLGLQQLADLRIKETQIGDRACFVFAKLLALESLNLKQTAVGDIGLRQLVALPRLHQVVLSDYGARLTPAGVAHLRQARPTCEVIVRGAAR